MASILIVESNSPDNLSKGNASAAGFVRTLLGLAPQTALRVVAPYTEAFDSRHLETADAVVFTGSLANWGTDAEEAAPLRRVMEQVFRAGVPVWGSCNGLQLAAVVLGGSVGASPNGMEVGLARNLRLTASGRAHPMMQGRVSGFAVPCMHRDQVMRMPEGAELLATNTHSPVQAMAYQRGGVDFWGTQYHPELAPSEVAHCVHEAGLFHNRCDQIADLEMAEFDAAAAARLGGTLAELQPPPRARELANWLDHVQAVSLAKGGSSTLMAVGE